jgi:hypothetical protein
VDFFRGKRTSVLSGILTPTGNAGIGRKEKLFYLLLGRAKLRGDEVQAIEV